MAILGINGTTNGLWLAVVSDDGAVVDAQASIDASENTPLDAQISSALAQAHRLIETYGVTTVAVLDAEPSSQVSFAQLVPRVSLEAAVMLAAHQASIPVARRSRAWVRSALGIPRQGALASHVASVVDAHPPHWQNQRDLAALVALAERKR